MVNLLDLPLEILDRIIQHLDGYVSREPGSRLTYDKMPIHALTCKRWCDIVLRVWHSHLSRKKLILSFNDLKRLPANETHVCKHIFAKTEQLSIQLVGRPVDHVETLPFWEDEGAVDMDGPSVAERGARESKPIDQRRYKNAVDRSLSRISQLVERPKLREVAFQAFPCFGRVGPGQWDYLRISSMHKFFARMPLNLKYLTIDMPGTDTTSSDETESAHLCPSIARVMLRAENVRLRTRHVCPAILGTDEIVFASSGLTQDTHPPRPRLFVRYVGGEKFYLDHRTRLKSLTLRLMKPHFASGGILHPPNSFRCPQYKLMKEAPIEHLMLFAGRHLLKLRPEITDFKISYAVVDPGTGGFLLYVTDVNTWVHMRAPVIRWWQDCGRAFWDPWESRSEKLRPIELEQGTTSSHDLLARRLIMGKVFPLDASAAKLIRPQPRPSIPVP